MTIRMMPFREYTDVFNVQPSGAWVLLIRTHDHIWNDKEWPLEVRESARKDCLDLAHTFTEEDLDSIARLQTYDQA